jgi:hypothetical protein
MADKSLKADALAVTLKEQSRSPWFLRLWFGGATELMVVQRNTSGRQLYGRGIGGSFRVEVHAGFRQLCVD